MFSILGTNGPDTLKGSNDPDFIDGMDGRDVIHGGDGADTLAGGLGQDELRGGPGSDRFLFRSLQELQSFDDLADLEVGDQIDLSSIKGLRVVVGEQLPDGVVPSQSSPVLLLTSGWYVYLYTAPSAFTWIATRGVALEERQPGSGILTVVSPRQLTGTDGADTLEGGRASDLIDGGEGADLLKGGSGADTLLGGAGSDTLEGGMGQDTLMGGAGDDTLRYASLEELKSYDDWGDLSAGDRVDLSSIKGLRVIVGERLPEGVVPSQSSPVLLLMSGWYVYLHTGPSASTWIATRGVALEERQPGSGILTVVSSRQLTGTDGADTLEGGRASDLIDGGDGPDLLKGGPGADTLLGGGGPDTLEGGVGQDTLMGGAGDDTLWYASLEELQSYDDWADLSAGDRVDLSSIKGLRVIVGERLPEDVVPSQNSPVLLLTSGYSIRAYSSPTEFNWITTRGVALEERQAGSGILTVASPRQLTGTDGADTLEGGRASDLIDGGEGPDLLRGGAGADTLLGGAGSDTLEGGMGQDTLMGGEGDDTLRYASLEELQSYDDWADLSAGDRVDLSSIKGLRVIVGERLPDGVVPSQSSPVLLLMSGWYVHLHTGPSVFTWIATRGVALEERQPGSGILTVVSSRQLTGTDGADTLEGGRASDLIDGGDGPDLLKGGPGADTLLGGGGPDTLEGGMGQDTLMGGAGDDTLRYFSLEELQSFDDWGDLSAGDRVDLSSIKGLRVIVGERLPEDVVPSQNSPVLLLTSGYSIRAYSSPTEFKWITSRGVALEERQAGSGILTVVSSRQLTGTDGADTLEGGRASDLIDGGAGNDLLSGDAGADTLSGGEGNDTLMGGPGYDLLIGGGGQDVFRFGNLEELLETTELRDLSFGDRLDFSGISHLRIVVSDSLPLSSAPTSQAPVLLVTSSDGAYLYTGGSQRVQSLRYQSLTLAEETAGSRVLVVIPGENLKGTSGADTLSGAAGPDRIESMRGDDLLRGGGGSDTLMGGDGPDTLIGGPGRDELTGGRGADVYLFESIADLTSGDSIRLMSTEDVVDLSRIAGLRILSGNRVPNGVVPSLDQPVLMLGDVSPYRIHFSASEHAELHIFDITYSSKVVLKETAPGSKILRMEGQPAPLSGTGFADELTGGPGLDSLIGHAGDDLLSGAGGFNILSGGQGNDTLVSAAGVDEMSGGKGLDTFRFTSLKAASATVITDLEHGEIVDFSAIKGLRVIFGNSLPAAFNPTSEQPVLHIPEWGAGRFYQQPGHPLGEIRFGSMTGLTEITPGTNIFRVKTALEGTEGPDTLISTRSQQLLSGGPGHDVLVSAWGFESMQGGSGSDVFKINSLSHLSHLRLLDFSQDDLLDFSGIRGLRIAHGNDLPAGAQPSESQPWLLLKTNGFLEFYRDSEQPESRMAIPGNPQLQETTPGSGVLKVVPGTESVQTFWFGLDGIQRPASSGATIQIVMISDGYTASQRELFLQKVSEYARGLTVPGPFVSVKPLDSFSSLFEVVALFVPSIDEGMSDDKLKREVDVAFDSRIHHPRAAVSGDFALADTFVKINLPSSAHQSAVVVLNTDYGRSTGGSISWMVTPASGPAPVAVLLHELGHTMFGFEDEYVENGVWSEDDEIPEWVDSVHLSSDPVNVPWAHWLGFKDELGVVGVYEGGMYRPDGIWRATQNSMMQQLGLPFSAPQKEHIVGFLYDLLGDYLDLDYRSTEHSFVARLSRDVPVDVSWSFNGQSLVVAGSGVSMADLQRTGAAPLVLHRLEVDSVDRSQNIRLKGILDATRQKEVQWLMWGTGEGDRLMGHEGDDLLWGGDGADTLVGLAGRDILQGGEGRDTVVYDVPFAAMNIGVQATGGPITVSHGHLGVDTLIGIERLMTRDTALAFDVEGTGGQAYRLYQAAFDRTPDPAGLGFYIWGLDEGRVSLVGAAQTFINSAEFRSMYGASPDDERFVSLLYQHVHHRMPDRGGLDFWLGALVNRNGAYDRTYSRAEVLVAFSESSENKANVIGVIGNGFEYLPFVAG